MVLTVKIRPRSREAKVEELGPGFYKIHVLSPPWRGEANREVVSVLASHFRIPASRIRILKGEKSRLKIISVETERKFS